MNTLAVIQAMSNERQHLWRKAGKQKLTADQRMRLRDIACRLERLWHEHRCEIVRPNRRFIEDRVRGDLFCDFVDKMRRDHRGAGADELDGYEVQQFAWPAVEAAEPDIPYDAVLDAVGAEVLREVLAELKTSAVPVSA